MQGIAGVIKFNDCVQEFWRPGFAVDWFGFVDRRAKNGRFYVGKVDKLLSRCSQILKPVPKIGSERDSGSHIIVVIVITSAGVCHTAYRYIPNTSCIE